MHRDQRLRHRRDFAAVSKKGRAYHDALLSIRVSRNGLGASRFGFGVSKRVGNAVVRNRVKRRLRAGVRALSPAPGWDVVISARAPAAGVDYHGLVRALSAVFRRARLLRPDVGRAARTTDEQ